MIDMPTIVPLTLIALLCGLVGFTLGLLYKRKQSREYEKSAIEYRARLEAEQHASEEKLALLKQNQQQLQQAFKALSAEALNANNRNFLDLAQTRLESFKRKPKGTS